jgi:hypothetical protein
VNTSVPNHPISIPNRPSHHYSEPLGDDGFLQAINDPSLIINPQALGFVPVNLWDKKDFTFGHLVDVFFQRRNTHNCHFTHKLFNALKLSSAFPNLAPFVGVEWITSDVFRVNKRVFGRLLDIKAIDGSLFHRQGNFPSHGFVELKEKEAHGLCSPQALVGVDFDCIRLIKHQGGLFVQSSTGEDIDNCGWLKSRNRTRE